jgi:hypothetical protein
MTYEGTIQNGVVVFSAAIPLPDGTPVRVEPTAISSPEKETKKEEHSTEIDPIFRMAELAADTGIPDLAVNIDHYLYGHPKVTDGP